MIAGNSNVMQSSFTLCLLISATLVLTSCSDPVSDVGLDLLEDETSARIHTIAPTSFSISSRVDITALASRVLIGSADDPVTGKISANGYFDFEGTFVGSPSEDITSARLILTRDYSYGDTLSSVQVTLHPILNSWDATKLESSSSLNLGEPILTTFVFGIQTIIDLPESWIRENENDLKSEDFESIFHGFALINAGSAQIVGFNSSNSLSSLEVVSASGTTSYTVSSTYTQVDRMSPEQTPSGFLLFQDGSGPGIEIVFDFETFDSEPINGAIFSFPAFTLADFPTPEHFVRSAPDSLQLFAVPLDESVQPFIIGVARMDQGEYRFASSIINVFIQSLLFGSQEIRHLEIRAPLANHSLDAVLFHDQDSGDLSPTLTLILPP